MRRRLFVRAVWLACGAAAARLLGLRPPAAAAAGSRMGGDIDEMMKMMMPGNMAGPMRTGMQLFMRHAQIRRTVTELPNGIHTVTQSDDPQTAALIRAHVSDMYRRLDQKRAFPYPMSRSVPVMFVHSTAYQRKLELIPKGVAVTETSDDSAMVAVIRAHAREISGFVREGMPAMMREMMR